jgi:hypothetical protein
MSAWVSRCRPCNMDSQTRLCVGRLCCPNKSQPCFFFVPFQMTMVAQAVLARARSTPMGFALMRQRPKQATHAVVCQAVCGTELHVQVRAMIACFPEGSMVGCWYVHFWSLTLAARCVVCFACPVAGLCTLSTPSQRLPSFDKSPHPAYNRLAQLATNRFSEFLLLGLLLCCAHRRGWLCRQQPMRWPGRTRLCGRASTWHWLQVGMSA